MAQPAGTSPATAQIPHVPEERLSIQPSDTTCSNVRVQYGFMEDPNVPEALEQACEQVAPASQNQLSSYFLATLHVQAPTPVFDERPLSFASKTIARHAL